jgi:thiol-disulfide isomerase/thioredoxin
MRLHYPLLLLCIISFTTHAQQTQFPSIDLGDPAPQLFVREWLKGSPVQRLEKGKVYVLEFWATWCKPCIAAMPHLSALAREYKDKVIVLGIDVMEKKTTSMAKVKALVDSMGNRMDFAVAVEDSNFMSDGWLHASGEQMIPNTFVVDLEGRLTWVGYPTKLDEVLPKIVNNTWDVKEALAKRTENKRLRELDLDANDFLFLYMTNPKKRDSALLVIDGMVGNNPQLKYAPLVGSNTFSLLLETDPHKAYEFGKVLIATPTYADPPYDLIIGTIQRVSEKSILPKETYQLGAEAYQAQIDQYPASKENPDTYYKMANLYWRANKKSEAIDAMQKAIEVLRSKKYFSKADMAAFEAKLRKYKNM